MQRVRVTAPPFYRLVPILSLEAWLVPIASCLIFVSEKKLDHAPVAETVSGTTGKLFGLSERYAGGAMHVHFHTPTVKIMRQYVYMRQLSRV